MDKAIRLLGDAASEGARLAVLPETFVSLYPSNAWARQAASFGGADELWERLWENALDVPGELVDELARACRTHDIHCAIGINERESERPGTIYNALLLVGPDGLLAKHCKLMPTHHEKLFHGIGAGDDLGVTETPLGRIGGLICWENRMPLARYTVYRGGPQIWIAPTADDSDGWLATVRHIAIESGAFVVSVPQYIPRSAFPDDLPVPLPQQDVFGRGGAAIIEPTCGKVIAGPLYDGEGMIVADCDLREGLHAKRWFDAVGHYSREYVLGPTQHLSIERELGARLTSRAYLGCYGCRKSRKPGSGVRGEGTERVAELCTCLSTRRTGRLLCKDRAAEAEPKPAIRVSSTSAPADQGARSDGILRRGAGRRV